MKSIVIVFVIGLMVVCYTPAHAVFIQVNDQGDILLYQDQVLGETEEGSKENDEMVRQEKVLTKPDKQIPADKKENTKTEIRLKPASKQDTSVQVLKKEGEKAETMEKKVEDRVQLEFQDKEAALRELRMKNEKELKAFKENLESSDTPDKEAALKRKKEELEKELNMKRQELKELSETGELKIEQNEESFRENAPLNPLPSPESSDKPQLTPEELQKRQLERKERSLKLRDAVRENKRELQLEGSDGTTARFGQGAEISVDAETGAVTLVTPTGQEKILNNFPEEVIARLKERQTLVTEDNTEIEVEVDGNGNIKHKVKNVRKQKKLFGFIPREVEAEAVVDDSTGEVEVSETKTNPVDQLLNALSI